MTNLLDRKSKFESVKHDLSAVQFHKERYEHGSVYKLAKECFQYWQVLKTNPAYAQHLNEMEKRSNGTSTES